MAPQGFGYKTGWLAVRTDNAEQVARALRIEDLRRESWANGVRAAYGEPSIDSALITPPIDGWVLVSGQSLAFLSDHFDNVLRPLMVKLSAELKTEVQAFATHRVVEAHFWARTTQGSLERAYSYIGESGEVKVDIGDPSEEEDLLGFSFFDPGSEESKDPGYWDDPDLEFPSEDHVMRLAAEWSVDPTQIDEFSCSSDTVWVGTATWSPDMARESVPPTPWWKFW